MTASEEEAQKRIGTLFSKFTQFAPDFKGPNTPKGAALNVISVFEKASIENGDGGNFVSQFGNKTWL